MFQELRVITLMSSLFFVYIYIIFLSGRGRKTYFLLETIIKVFDNLWKVEKDTLSWDVSCSNSFDRRWTEWCTWPHLVQMGTINRLVLFFSCLCFLSTQNKATWINDETCNLFLCFPQISYIFVFFFLLFI